MKYIIDAKGKRLGKIAADVARILIGKNSTSFVRNANPEVELTVTNVNEIDVPFKKSEQKEYKYYSGYPGGLRFETLKAAITKKGKSEVLRKTVWGMLPKNKLRAKMIKNLKIK